MMSRANRFVVLKVVLPKSPDPELELEAFVSTWKGRDHDPREGTAS